MIAPRHRLSSKFRRFGLKLATPNSLETTYSKSRLKQSSSPNTARYLSLNLSLSRHNQPRSGRSKGRSTKMRPNVFYTGTPRTTLVSPQTDSHTTLGRLQSSRSLKISINFRKAKTSKVSLPTGARATKW